MFRHSLGNRPAVLTSCYGGILGCAQQQLARAQSTRRKEENGGVVFGCYVEGWLSCGRHSITSRGQQSTTLLATSKQYDPPRGSARQEEQASQVSQNIGSRCPSQR